VELLDTRSPDVFVLPVALRTVSEIKTCNGFVGSNFAQGRPQWPRVGLGPLACWDCGFESPHGHGHFSVVNVVCCHVEVSAAG